MERATYATKSFVIALALVRGRLDVEQAAQAANVEVNSQIERWGEVEDCTFNLLIGRNLVTYLIAHSAHDVDYQDIRRQLGSVACLVS